MPAKISDEKIILGIDPGNIETAYLFMKGNKILTGGKTLNERMLDILDSWDYSVVGCEMICSYGMPAGASLFDTCVFIGQILSHSTSPVTLIPRIQIKSHLCHSGKAKDANIRQALIDKYGPQGTKKNPGPTYGISADVWSALAVADTFQSGDFTPYILSADKPENEPNPTKNGKQNTGA